MGRSCERAEADRGERTPGRPRVGIPAGVAHRLVTPPVFRFLVEFEEQKALRLQYCFSLLWLRFETEEFGAESPEWLGHCTGSVLAGVRATDVVTLLEPTTLAVMLVDAAASDVPAVVGRLTQAWALPAGDSTAPRHWWSAGAACYPRDGSRSDAVLGTARSRMERARLEGRNRLLVGPD